ncbi:MAG: RDD family protein [Candidatus Woesearchaeota archaeon]
MVDMESYKKLNLPEKKNYLVPASPLKRFAALVIDIFLLNFVVISPFSGVLRRIIPTENISYEWILANSEVTSIIYVLMFFIALLSLLYFAVLESRLGQTLGKMMMNIHVINLSDLIRSGEKQKTKAKSISERKISFFQAVIRNLFVFPFFPFALLWIIDPAFMIFSKNGQRLSERLSKNMTVEVLSQ